MGSKRHVVASPRESTFAADAHRLAELIPAELDDAAAIEWYAGELKRTYPNAVVRAQEDLARTETSGPPVWYASNRRPGFRIDIALDVPLASDVAFSIYTERVTEWQTAVQLVPRPGGASVLVGREYEACYRFLGFQYTGSFRVMAADPPRSVTFEASGSGIAVWYTTSFEPAPEGCRVSIRGDYDLPDTLLARIADRLLLERSIARDITHANEAYARLCARVAGESRASSA